MVKLRVLSFSNSQEVTSMKNGAQTDYRNSYAMNLLHTNIQSVLEWYQQRLAALGEMTVEEADLTDGEKWKWIFSPIRFRKLLTSLFPFKKFAQLIQVKLVDGAFFVLTGQKVTRFNSSGVIEFSWIQPGLLQKEEPLTFPTPDGPQTLLTSGIVGLVLDQDGNVLLTLGQEPFARTPKRALFRTPFQTSATKLSGLLKGERQLDPGLYDLLQEAGAGKEIHVLFETGFLSLFPLAFADANRISATNLGFLLVVTDADFRSRLEKNGQNRWFSEQEVNFAVKAGLLNGHTCSAVLASRA